MCGSVTDKCPSACTNFCSSPASLSFIISVCSSSRTRSQPQADRSGSGPTGGKEVGGVIDKLMNDVIGRINGAPWGTMSTPACWCDRLSGESAALRRGRECTSSVWHVTEAAVASAATPCLIHPHDRTMEQHGAHCEDSQRTGVQNSPPRLRKESF